MATDPRGIYNTWDPNSGVSVLDFLTNSLLAQQKAGTANMWQGEGLGSKEANARGMADHLARSGITNLNQVGVNENYIRPNWAQTEAIRVGMGGSTDPNGGSDASAQNAMIAQQRADILSGKTKPTGTRTIVNKVTNEPLYSGYGERTKGDAFSGTYAGKGNTSFSVKMDSQGNPVFYTTGADSSDYKKIAPILDLASIFIPVAAPFIQGGKAAYNLSQGNTKGALLGALGAVGGAGLGELSSIANYGSKAFGAYNAIKNKDPLALLQTGIGFANQAGMGSPELSMIGKGIGYAKPFLSDMFKGGGSTQQRPTATQQRPQQQTPLSRGLAPSTAQSGGQQNLASLFQNLARQQSMTQARPQTRMQDRSTRWKASPTLA